MLSDDDRDELRHRALLAWHNAEGLARHAQDLTEDALDHLASTRQIMSSWRAFRSSLDRQRMVMTVIDEVLAADVPATSPLWRRDGPLALVAMTELGGVMSVYEAARKRSWRIVDATNGAQAVGVAMLVQPDCALLDANVATLSGLEVADGLHVYAPRTAVLVLTGDADVDAEARAAGFATLGKSAPLAEILTTMEQLVA